MNVLRIANSLFAVLALLAAGNACAGCWITSGNAVTTAINPESSSIAVKRNAAPNQVIYDSNWVNGGITEVRCTGSNSVNIGYYSITPASPLGDDIVSSTNPSIGIRVYYSNSSNVGTYGNVLTSTRRNIESFNGGVFGTNYVPASFYRVQLVVIAPIVEGSVTTYTPLAYTDYSGVTVNQVNFPPMYIYPQSLSCQVNTTQLQVPLGDVQANSLTQVGATSVSKDFQVGLTCESETIVSVALGGTQNGDTSDTSVLALTNAGQSGVATGLGVQILQNSTPLRINETRTIVNSANTSEMLNFTARYYQTKPKVMPGSANTTALLNITYQ